MRSPRLAVLALLLLAGPASASWLTEGQNAARTFSTGENGPATEDVAFTVQLPPTDFHGLGIHEGAVYAMSGVAGEPKTLWRVRLQDARAEPFLELGANVDWSADATTVYVSEGPVVRAYGFADAARAWESVLPASGGASYTCIQPAISGATLYYSCVDNGTAQSGVLSPRAVAHALDARTGTILWTSADPRSGLPEPGPLAGSPLATAERYGFVGLSGISVLGDHALVVLQYQTFQGEALDVSSLDRVTGEREWTVRSQVNATRTATQTTTPSIRNFQAASALVTGDARAAYAKLRDVSALDLETGSVVWEHPLAPGISDATSLALQGDSLFLAAGPSLTRLTTEGREDAWSFVLTNGLEWSRYGLVVTPERVYALARPQDLRVGTVAGEIDPEPDPTGRELYAFETSTGRPLWRRSAATTRDTNPMAVGEGVLAYNSQDGLLTVIGRTPAAIQPQLAVSSLYPAAGEVVVADLAGTRPGIQASDLEYRAEWGDGAVSDWSNGTRLEHTYAQDGEHVATFRVRNGAGQTASEMRTFRVGASPPVEPNLIETWFATERQDTTFFVLGLLLTGAGAIGGLALRQRRRDLLEREIRDAETETARLRATPIECERMLDERRRRARELFMRRRLDESQTNVLDARIEELRRSVRLGAVEGVLGELPHNLVVALQQMLRDGRINAWERRHLVDLLERSEVLSADQKARVKALVERWHAHDDAAGP